MKKIWITWERHRRTAELAAALEDIRLYEIELEANRIIRYAYLLSKTLLVLLREASQLVIIQSPSIVLAFFMVTFGKFFISRVIVDAHNEGIMPFYKKYLRFLPVYRFIQRRSDLTIVTNKNLAAEVRRNGGTPIVLEDRVPKFDRFSRIPLEGKFNVVFICTFEKDEPYQEVVQSAHLLDPHVFIYVTGRHEKVASELVAAAPSNVIFTGFLSEAACENAMFIQ